MQSDSRRYATKIINKLNKNLVKQVNWKSRSLQFVLSFLIALGLSYVIKEPSFTEGQTSVLFILIFAVGLWVTEAIPPFAVGILIIGALVFTMSNLESENVKQYVQTWSDSVIWLFLGGFFIAQAMQKTALDQSLLKFIVPKLGEKSKYILLGLMLITAFLSMLMSNTATTAMMIASITPITLSLGKEAPLTKALLIGIPTAAAIGGMGTIIGSAPNAIAVGALDGIGIRISFMEWMLIGIPVALILIFGFWYGLLKKYKIKRKSLDLSFLQKTKQNTDANITTSQVRVTVIIIVASLIFWLSSQWTGIPVAAVSGIPIVGLTMFGILDADDMRKLPWDTLMLVAGGLALGIAVQQQGLTDYFISFINIKDFNFYLLAIIFALISVVFSNIMSNTATTTIMIPLAISFAALIPEQSPKIIPLIIALSASCALLLPVSTPPNAIAHSTGKLDQKDFRFGGIFIGIIGPILVSLWVILVEFI
ncbi:solute carrier family 13 (sodium-dependent dicarboxylate transporter), member 2/3/5 [Psychroflexus salarius]|uniref:Solute carrier family 13 (Sodium-dependent dicarboxylate transporter), member 2/3/5 n=1 Tax=Psychroflexus salarius TaxID=1155689 RepID=A0A1M4XWW0_9FLAO|nr:SLC13 family permease [Psychroflexus salarius]SHE98047.1 solute carrier family 13 (sodium-dependent dicarboxylate transporter), member 2/3/5 [Psychroflexus salarius]